MLSGGSLAAIRIVLTQNRGMKTTIGSLCKPSTVKMNWASGVDRWARPKSWRGWPRAEVNSYVKAHIPG